MIATDASPALPTAQNQTNASKWTFATATTFIAVTVFIIIEIVAFAGATVWSISGLLHFGQIPTIILAVIVGLPSLWACYKVIPLAFNAESDPEE